MEILPVRYHEPARDVPLKGSFDVLVCGGGPAGALAALASGRQGAHTGLIEQYGVLGGIWTSGGLPHVLDGDHPGLLRELRERLWKRDALPGGRKGARWDADPEMLARELEDLCCEAGVALRYYTRVCAAYRNREGRLDTLITESKSGREAWQAKVIIDCTGDGDVGFLAGCGYDIGQPGSGLCQPMTLCAVLTGLPPATHPPFAIADPRERKAWFLSEVRRAGHEPSYANPVLHRLPGGLALLMANHVYDYRGPDAGRLTTATREARSENLRLVTALQRLGGDWEHLRIASQGTQIGIRESRRIHGLYTVRPDDLERGIRHADAVCRVRFGVDIHSLDGNRHRGIEKKPFEVRPYDIPLRALIARDADGLMMAGRCISGSFEAHASYRVSGIAAALGQAAGTAAAVAAARGIRLRDLPFEAIRPLLPEPA